MKPAKKEPKDKPSTYRVWMPQINQQIVEVTATCTADAFEKAARKWRREFGHSQGNYFEKVE